VPVERDDEQHHGGHGPRVAGRAGQQLLQAAAARHGPLLLRQPAAGGPGHGRARRRVRGQRDAMEGAVRGRHGEDGPHRRADGEVRGGQAQLQPRQPDLLLARPAGFGFDRRRRRRRCELIKVPVTVYPPSGAAVYGPLVIWPFMACMHAF
jgi:hypothetical protein